MMQKKLILLIPDVAGWILGTWSKKIDEYNRDKYRFIIFPSMEIDERKTLFYELLEKADVVHCLGQSVFSHVRKIIAAAPLKTLPKIISSVYHVVEDSLIQENLTADRIMVMCRKYYDYLLGKGVSREKLFMIHIGVDTDFFRPMDKRQARRDLGLPGEMFAIGYSGKFSKEPGNRKGTDFLLKILSSFASDRYKDLRLIISGPKWQDYVCNGGFPPEKIIFMEYLPPEKMNRYYNALDVLLVTSRIEGGPAPLFEAMSCGISVVSTPVGMVPDYVRDQQNGYLIDFDDAEKARGLLEQLYDNRKRVDETGREARKTVEDHLTWEKTVSGMKGLYDFPENEGVKDSVLSDPELQKLNRELIEKDDAKWMKILYGDQK